VYVFVRVWRRDNVETWAQIIHIMGTETVVIVLNNSGVKLGFYIEN